ncbi:MarR family winged helix-turn-helix transcriptional regulator [Mucilaginibacter sp. AW1-7]|jgi:DNA-binding MarR family transcriptional regulator|uniref:MarR family winged helix-turn-helix transcriptional regulator n=1 Tax=unclassified Mucilaginibacter TaxID=2617802 RepID=UPI0008CCF5A0|nr:MULTISPECIES: winged helix DNA-binding protein [unclassified Mucilaginibacter]WDF75611.1 winged helix DNA-binding protein [Mucilaginibacter sp. KACC 22773]SEP44675.1 DNA-binding transcriptional regulator, MarR family [Mucilaginibacter sp. OK283]
MKSYKLIHQLISLVEEMEKEHKGDEVSIQDFTGFLLNHVADPTDEYVNGDVRFGKSEKMALEVAYQLDNNIGRLFVFMSRYAKFYIKKALDGTPLQTAEEFTGLAILLTHDHLTKSELINYNLQEKTSGTEVIRRLIAAGLARQWDNPEDKRGKYVGITDKGKQLLYEVFVDTSYAGKMITGKLSIPEKLTLQHLLQKLEDFHYEHHEKKTISTKADMKAFIEEGVD